MAAGKRRLSDVFIETLLDRLTPPRAAVLPFRDFLRETAHPRWSYDAPHFECICGALDALEAGEYDRLAFFMPPRHGKTETVTIRKAAHLLEEAERRREPVNILITAHTDRYARRLSRKLRTLVSERIGVLSDKTATDEWETPGGSLVMARGVGSPPTGTGFHWVFVDDPIKSREQAESEVKRERMHDWWEDIYSRLEPGARVVLTLTRWHFDDIAQRAIDLEPHRWKVVCLRAIAEDDDPLGREPGEALWPERWPAHELLKLKAAYTRKHGAYAWDSLYQQRPAPKEGLVFRVGALRVVDQLPALSPHARAVRAWDLAATAEADASYTAAVLMVGPDVDGCYGILDVTRFQEDAAERNKLIRATADKDGPPVTIRLPQDPGSAGKEVAALLVNLLRGYNVVVRTVTGSKEHRADALATQVNAGRVWLKRGEWNAEFIEELRRFPRWRFKDQVDAAADAFSEIVFETPEEEVLDLYQPSHISPY